MGMYTKVNLISTLKKDTDVNKFLEENWYLNCSSYYHTGTSNTKYFKEENVIHIDCDFKDYPEDRLGNILKWLKENSTENYNRFLGYSRYEETNNPTLYFINKGKITEFTNKNVEEHF